MTKCAHCGREIAAAERRLRFDGTVAWTAAAKPTADETALKGASEYCSIRCFGTRIGVTLQERGLQAPKKD
jgi:hypothetical protein